MPYLYALARDGSYPCILLLLKQTKDLYLLNVAWFSATKSSDKESTELLLKNGVDIKVKDEFGNTSAHIAVWHRNETMLLFLGKKGVDLNIQNKNRFEETCLHMLDAINKCSSIIYQIFHL